MSRSLLYLYVIDMATVSLSIALHNCILILTTATAGIPVAWMLASDGTEATITYWLQKVRERTPDVTPKWFMSDRDHAEINALERVYPEAAVILCWWHVLHAWQQHFKVTEYPELWKLLQGWIRITTDTMFLERWDAILAIAPPSVTEYLRSYWIPYRKWWSAVSRVGRNIWEANNTNMLLEACVQDNSIQHT